MCPKRPEHPEPDSVPCGIFGSVFFGPYELMKNSIIDNLIARGYGYDKVSRVLLRPDYASISYNDGDSVEIRLQTVINTASDLSVFSPELAAACTDWPSHYHLSSDRANLLRPFSRYLGANCRVLEIGAGCGAITRFLGESGSEVLALEGSLRRASIAAARTRDLPNVAVIAERFEDFQSLEKFDVITLIGVLEYASLFTDATPPAVRMLSRINELLAPGGRLIVAIENQLGLKYFAGALEDHLGDPMVGIENRYEEIGPRTFGRVALKRLLESAGLDATYFMAPYPDYKTPFSIVTEDGVTARDFDGSAFAWQSSRSDLQAIDAPFFNLELVWPTVFHNGLGLDLANSFLIEARRSNECEAGYLSSIPDQILAYHYSTRRRPQFNRETLFVRSPQAIETQSRLLGSVSSPMAGDVRHHLIERAPYVFGDVVALRIIQILKSPGWSTEKLGEAFHVYLNALRDFLSADGIAEQPRQLDDLIPSRMLDAIPRNLIRGQDGVVHYIDSEWALTSETIPLGWLIFRALLHTLNSIALGPPAVTVAAVTLGDLLSTLFDELGLPLSEAKKIDYVEREASFQHAISGTSIQTCRITVERILALS